MADEITYYSDQNGIRVTNSRVIIGNTTYALPNITSVSRTVTEPSRGGPILFVLIGVLLLFMGKDALIGGIVLAVIGVLWWIGQKPTYHLRLSSASGESNALSSSNDDHIDRVVQAINEAFIKSG